MKVLNGLALTLVIVGALNWGLVAIAKFDLVAWVFGEEFGTTNAVTRIVYGLVGVAGVYLAATLLPAVLPENDRRAFGERDHPPRGPDLRRAHGAPHILRMTPMFRNRSGSGWGDQGAVPGRDGERRARFGDVSLCNE